MSSASNWQKGHLRVLKRNCGKLATHNKRLCDAEVGAAAVDVAEAAPGRRRVALRDNRRAYKSRQEISEQRAESRECAEELAAMKAEIEAEDELHQQLLA